MTYTVRTRFLPVGAETLAIEGGVDFRVWAPLRSDITVVIQTPDKSMQREQSLQRDSYGYFHDIVPFARAGMFYQFRIDHQPKLYPDPASRFQPYGPDGWSQIVDPGTFLWTDTAWKGIPTDNRVLYEMHIGTYTPEGTWTAALRELDALKELGITIIELMPVGDFSGEFGWGYDGVCIFAPTHLYGTVEDFKRFVNEAHRRDIGVILDVVYNHFGRNSDYLDQYSPFYFTDKYTNEWGKAINFDGYLSEPVREFILANVRYWIQEFHLDGFRIDATQQIFDHSPKHILGEIAETITEVSSHKKTFLIAENEPQDISLYWQHGFNGVWNDDFHHTATVALTGHHEAYYTDYRGKAQEFISSAKWGYLYQGQYYTWQKKKRGTPSFNIPPSYFINYLQNHDQIANTCRGLRIHHLAHPGAFKAMTALLLLLPQIPLLFQGQEFAASSPFYYFADHPEAADRIKKRRAAFLSQFPSIASVNGPLTPPPTSRMCFEHCKLRLGERISHAPIYNLHADLLKLRRSEKIYKKQYRSGVDGSVVRQDCFVIRLFGLCALDDRLIVVNLGSDIQLAPMPEPLLASPPGYEWKMIWYSENPLYGGQGAAPFISKGAWNITGNCTYFLAPRA